ncbi:MAG: hypothetical protein ACRYGR_06640 [Janthinobacterium lividum]
MSTITSTSLAKPSLPYEGSDPKKIQETAEKFTSVFYAQFVGEMMKEQESIGGFGEEMFQSFLSESIAEQLTLSDSGQDMVSTISQQLIQLQNGGKISLAPENISSTQGDSK